jgi:hypothetical protein
MATQLVQRIDDYGTPAWIGLSVLGFLIWWPAGLAMLAFTWWSGRMSGNSMSRWEQKVARMQERMGAMGARMGAPGGFGMSRSSGNAAFDSYREETLRRLEDEQREFQSFLERLRQARDKSEFDQFMSERRRNGERPSQPPTDATEI